MKSLCLTLAVVAGLGGLVIKPVLADEQNKEELKTGETMVIAYEGKQSWPTGENAQVIKGYAVPIYIGLPAKRYTVVGRICDSRTSGVEVVERGFDEAFGKERHRMRNCANQAKRQGGDAVLVTDDERVLKPFNLSSRELKETAPLFDHKDKIVLIIKF
jgi:hypothetical protein